MEVTEEYGFQISARKCLEHSCHRRVVRLKERFQRRAKRNAVEFQRKSIHPPSLCDSNVAVVRAPKKACLNNEVYGLRPAGAAIKTIDSRAYKGCKCWREHNGVSGEAVAVNTGIIASLKS